MMLALKKTPTKFQTILISLAFLTGCNQVFYQPMEEIVALPSQFGVAWIPVRISVSGNQTLGAWWMKAARPAKVLVLQFHGNAQNRSTHMNFVAWLTQHECDVVVVDYRGYGDSDGSPSRAASVEDAVAAIRWTRDNPGTSNLPLVVIGQSLGGAVAVTALAQKGSDGAARGLILDSAFSSYREMARAKLAGVWLSWPLQWPMSFLVSDELSPRDHAAKVTIPVLDFHSKGDPVVPYALGRELFDSLGAKNKKWIAVEPASHTGAFGVEDDTYREAALEFIRDLNREVRADQPCKSRRTRHPHPVQGI